MTTTARTVCDPNCHANPKCGLEATLDEGRIIAVEPAQYPAPGFENRICLMGRSRLEYQYHPERLRKPLKRVGERGEGRWEEISWEEAVALFVDNQRRIAEKWGPKSILFHQISGAYGLLTRGAPLRYAALTGASAVRAERHRLWRRQGPRGNVRRARGNLLQVWRTLPERYVEFEADDHLGRQSRSDPERRSRRPERSATRRHRARVHRPGAE